MRLDRALVFGLLVGAAVCWGDGTSREQQASDAYARWEQFGTATPAEKLLMEDVLFSQPEPARDTPLDESAGPDGFGYQFTDNQTPDTATFDWVELCGDTLAQFGPSGDDYAGPVTWSFPFSFYGTTYTSGFVSTNGKITFETADPAWLNRCASVDATRPEISVYWDDMVAQQTEDCGDGTPRIKFRDFGYRLVVEWKDVWHYPYSYPDQRSSFEAILFADGKIKMQYDTLNFGGYDNSCTVAVDVPGPNGVEYVCNGMPAERQLVSHRALWLYRAGNTFSPPTELTAQLAGEDLVLRWLPVPFATSYNVYRDSTSNVVPIPERLVAVTADTSFTDVGAISGVSRYYYTVTAATP